MADVIQTRCIEVVGADGRVRAILGELARPETEAFGLALLDETGEERVVLVLDEDGSHLEFTNSARNVALTLGVSEAGGEAEPGSYLLLMDTDGVPVRWWRVGPERTVLTGEAAKMAATVELTRQQFRATVAEPADKPVRVDEDDERQPGT
jgi:hypothetical protein